MSNIKMILRRSLAVALCAVLIGGTAVSMPVLGYESSQTVNAVTAASDFEYSISGSNVTITRYIGSDSQVVIPSTIEGKNVTNIGFYAFETTSNVEKVVVSDGILSIDSNAFNGCSSLSEIVLPNTLKSISSNAFSGCSSLTQITIPGSVEEIGSYAFNACSDLQRVVISDGVQSLGNYCFNACSSLESVTISKTLKTIPSYAFNACSSLAEIKIPEGVQTIKPYAFNACSDLEKATIAKSVTRISSFAFGFGNEDLLTIYGSYGSEAESFAAENGYAFVGDGSSTPSEITSISLNKKVLNLDPGTSASLVATVLPSSADPGTLSWSSSDSSVANVSNGLVTAVAPGAASISVRTSNGKSASCTVIVSDPNEEGNSFTIDKSSVELAQGSTTTLTAILVVNSSSGNNNVTWSSSNTSVAYVSGTSTSIQSSGGSTKTTTDSSGNVTITYIQGKMTTTSKATVKASSAGTAILTATAADGSTQSCIVTVTGNTVYITNVILNKTSTSIIKGSTEKLTATVYPTNASDKTINWKSSNKSVVTVNDGTLTAVSEGSAIITASSPNGPSATCTVNVTSNTVAVTSVSLDKTSASLVEGESITLTPTVSPSNATNKNITWQTGNSKVATVSDGKVTAVSAGTTTITARSNNGKTATCSITVKAPVVDVTSVKLNKSTLSLVTGKSDTLTATISPSNATSKSISWSSSNTNVATVSSDGTVKAVGAGYATITAKSNNGKTAQCTVTATDPVVDVTSVSLNQTSLSLTTGNSSILAASVLPSNATNKTITWLSSNTNVVTVSGGLVKAVAAGSATITARSNNGKTAICTVTVKDPVIEVTSVSLNKTSLSLVKGNSQTLTASVTPTNATNKTITWKSSNTNVATVSNGKISATAAGTATITATTSNGLVASCKVTVTNPVIEVSSISLNKTTLSLAKGKSETLAATISPSNATNKTISWSSSNTNVATVSGGKITAVSAGTATITVKSSNGKTASCKVTVTNPVISKFEWGKDNWNFTNSYDYFGTGTYRSQLNSKYAEILKQNLTNSEYQAIFTGRNAWLDNKWGGSCYGMSVTTLLNKEGLFPIKQYKSDATSLHSFNSPKYSTDLNSVITYYQMLQVKDAPQQIFRAHARRSHEANIKDIISQLQDNSTVVVCFGTRTGYGHAILAYGYEYGTYKYHGDTFQGCIKICDPNFANQYYKDANIYFKTSNYEWTIPVYRDLPDWQASSAQGAYLDMCCADLDVLNKGGYHSGTTARQTGAFVARVDAPEISENRSIAKVLNDDGSYFVRSSFSNDIVEDYSYFLRGDESGTIGYTLYDPDSAYRIEQDQAEKLDLRMDYEFSDMYAYSDSGKAVVFDPQKCAVMLESDKSDFRIGMILDEDYNTDWFAIDVTGTGATNASLQKYEDGYLLCSDGLKNSTINANNRDDEAAVSFSTTSDKVYIYEINKNRIGLKIDTNGDGSFETDITPRDENDPALLGDVNDDETVDIGDALMVARYDAGLIELDDAHRIAGDVNGNGETDIADALMIARYDAGLITSFSAA